MNKFFKTVKTVKLIMQSHAENVKLGDTLREMNGYLVALMKVISNFWQYTLAKAITRDVDINSVLEQSVDDGMLSSFIAFYLDEERESSVFPLMAVSSSLKLKLVVTVSLASECWKRRGGISEVLKSAQDADEALRAALEKKVRIIREVTEHVARLQPVMAGLAIRDDGIPYPEELAEDVTGVLEVTSQYLIDGGHVDADTFGQASITLQELLDCGLSETDAVAFVTKYVCINSTEMLGDLRAALKNKNLRPFIDKYPRGTDES